VRESRAPAVAIVTGASRGIGRAIAVRLAADGLAVAVTGRDRACLDAVVAEIAAAGGRALAVGADLAREPDIEHLVDAVEGQLGSPDVLVNNAGMATLGRVDQTSFADFRAMIEVNLLGTILVTRAVVPGMAERGHGHVVALTSPVGRAPRPFLATYSATKAAVNAFHDALRQELRTQGVRVSVVEVDKVATGFGDRWPAALHDEAERAWRAGGFKFHGEPVSVADVADVVSFVVDRRPAVALNVIRVQPAIEDPTEP
jgi:NADP-dependent 3-hydroxy acid dehydrogenase YdfG